VSVLQRSVASLVFLAAVGAWIAVAFLFANVSPAGNATAQLLGALLLGSAAGLTAWPLLWRLGASTTSGTAGGDWLRAGRRAGLVGLSLSMLVLLRVLGAFSLPLALFIIVLALLVEAAFTLRR
jgi:hypothetical protein